MGSFFQSRSKQGSWDLIGELPFSKCEGLPASSVSGHPGVFKFFIHKKKKHVLCFQVGRLHGYEGLSPKTVVLPAMLSRMAGTKIFILTNAAGSLQKKLKMGSVMIIEDQVNLTGQNPLNGPNPTNPFSGNPLGPRFPDMSAAYDKEVNQALAKMLKKAQIPVGRGTYLGVSGPAYETPAEIRLFSSWGIGSVGMSTVWETIALRHSGARVGGLSFISNMGAGLLKKELRHEDVEREGKKIALKFISALFDFGETYAGF